MDSIFDNNSCKIRMHNTNSQQPSASEKKGQNSSTTYLRSADSITSFI